MIKVFYVNSGNANEEAINRDNHELISRLARLSGLELKAYDDINALDGRSFSLVFVGGGGTEGKIRAVYEKLYQPVYLITTNGNNSLAAAMETLSFLNQQGIAGEIIHGDDEAMARRILVLYRVTQARERIRHFTVGRVGKPSDWLISSDVDAEKSLEINGIKVVDITMEEFFAQIARAEYEDNRFTRELKEKGYDPETMEKSLQIYGALKRLCQKYGLDGVTVRCFDLLGPQHNTGCAALAILNSEGIYGGCEGDLPALISMCILGELSGQPVFMANPSRISRERNEIIFAHCTLPLSMPVSYSLMTHYESGLGVAFRGVLPAGPVTVFKCSGLLDRYFVSRGQLLENLQDDRLCRTQIRLHLEESVEYFFNKPIGNHHLIVCGDYADMVAEFFRK